MKKAPTLDEIRTRIPAFTCKDGCRDCCGPKVLMKTEEARELLSAVYGNHRPFC